MTFYITDNPKNPEQPGHISLKKLLKSVTMGNSLLYGNGVGVVSWSHSEQFLRVFRFKLSKKLSLMSSPTRQKGNTKVKYKVNVFYLLGWRISIIRFPSYFINQI